MSRVKIESKLKCDKISRYREVTVEKPYAD